MIEPLQNMVRTVRATLEKAPPSLRRYNRRGMVITPAAAHSFA